MSAWTSVPGHGDVLAIVDHASNRVPDGVDLGIDSALMDTHIAWDIGAAALARTIGFPALLANVSRLVIDFNREPDSPSLIPLSSDGITIPGNPGDIEARTALWHDYHEALSEKIRDIQPKLLLSLHSFTPRLAGQPSDARPWQIGILYNNDDRAARIAIPLLEAAGVMVGDQLPYSGTSLNATMNRHGEGTATPYLGIEVRQDLIGNAAGVAKWAAVLKPVIAACLDQLTASREAGAR